MKPIITLCGILILIIVTFPTSAQIERIERLAVQTTNDQQVTFYNLDDSGRFEVLQELTDEFRQRRYPELYFLPPAGTLSPDGQSVAFIGYRLDEGRQETVLFLYALGQPGLHQVDIPAIADLIWSPASDAILLVPPGFLYDGMTLRDVYVYDLQSEVLTSLTDTPEESEGNVAWLPDSDQILFAGPHIPCQVSCSSYASDLYLMNRNGENRLPLTDLDSQVPPHPTLSYFYCVPADAIWSNVEARIYYIARCMEGDHYHDHLYSVSLDGDNRLETNLPLIYPTDRYTIIKDIYPSAAGIYLTVFHETEPTPDEPMVDSWRVFRVSQPENVEIIFEYNAPLSYILADSMISPDERRIAFGISIDGSTNSGSLLVVSLVTGQIESELETLEQVCGVAWLDNESLFYNLYSQMFCSSPAGTWILDIEKNIQLEITDGLEGVVSVSLNR